MAVNDGNDDKRPGRRPKASYKPIKIPKPIDVPDSCQTTPRGGLASPWMKLGYEMGLNLTAPRTPTDQPKENAPPVGSNVAFPNKSSLPQQKAGAPAPPALTPKRPKKVGAKNQTPSKGISSDSAESDISHWSSSRRNSSTRTEHSFECYSDNGNGWHPMPIKRSYSAGEEAYQYGARDDDEHDEFAETYDGDDTDARRRRY
ncbi:hypothetical protein Daus18300_014492 [Diaporthe australafricana]|uniref:Uncharacterized protein n=1 Tax=Diaporthe australafricana TaxID=127596 RepID=A0ABR3VUY9_9PEZI